MSCFTLHLSQNSFSIFVNIDFYELQNYSCLCKSIDSCTWIHYRHHYHYHCHDDSEDDDEDDKDDDDDDGHCQNKYDPIVR